MVHRIINFICGRFCYDGLVEDDIPSNYNQQRQQLKWQTAFRSTFNSDVHMTADPSKGRDLDGKLRHIFDPICISLAEISSTSGIQDTCRLLQSQHLKQNQANFNAKPAQKHDATSNSSNRHQLQQQQTNLLKPYPCKIRDDPDPPTNPSSSLTLQEHLGGLTKLQDKWDTEMQMDIFIRSKVGNLYRSYQDLFIDIVKNCHQTIEDHLKPDWSTTVTRYAQIMARVHENKRTFDCAYSKDIKDKRLENKDLMPRLKVYIMQKICFDNAILSCFKQIVNEYENGHHNEDIDLNSNETIQDIMDKINLEIKRIGMKLPIYANRCKNQQQVNKYQVVIIKGQAGGAKSTQIAQYVAEFNIGKVICTQPTKMAAIRLAHHLTREYAHKDSSIDCIINRNSLQSIDCIINRKSLHQQSHTDSIITFVTDSILLDLLVDDPTLSSYSYVVVDQAHQRSLYTDILLALLKQVLTRRHDLKLIIISANIDIKLFSEYFNDCPVISVSGKEFPFDIKWCNEHVNNYLDKALDIVVDIHNTGDKGDILVFLVTPDETEKARADIKKRLSNHPESIIPLPLHDDLQEIDLQNIFKVDSSGRRKIIFATNCAEISITTIPGIGYVIDAGLVKERVRDDQSNYHSPCTSIHPVSQSLTIQHCDYAGRIKSGACYRLYSQQIYDNMPQSSEPEIKRIHLSNVILKMIELGVTDVRNFNFIQPPLSQHMSDSLDILCTCMLSAITAGMSPSSLTCKGKLFCKLPLEPRLSALIMNANEWNILPEGIIIASVLSISCYYRHGSKKDKRDLDVINTQFCYSDGDVISTAQAYITWRSLCGKREYDHWCNENKINQKLMQQLDSKVSELQQSLRHLRIINQANVMMIPSRLKSRDKLRQLVFQCYHDRLALFTGVHKIGYITTYTDNPTLIDKSSTLSPLGIKPKLVIYQEIFAKGNDFFTLMNITPVDEKWLQSIDDCNSYAKIKDKLNRLVVTHTIHHLGSIVLSDYDINNVYKMMNKLFQQENIKCNIIANVKGGHLQITTLKSDMARLLDIVNKSIAHKKQQLMKAIKILSKDDGKDATRLIIGRGIIVNDILLPSDCNEFEVILRYTGNDRPHQDTTKEAINQAQSILMACGELAVDIDSDCINNLKDWRLIRFDKIVYQKIPCQSILKAVDKKIIADYEIIIQDASLVNYRLTRHRIVVQFCWPRRPRNGKGRITCTDRVAAMNIENDFPLTIADHRFDARIDTHYPNQLLLRQIPNFITAADIRMAISVVNRQAITEIDFDRATRSSNQLICSSDLESSLRSMLDKNGYYGMYCKVIVKPSVKKNPNRMADVLFRSYDDAVSAVQSFDGGVYEELINEPISVRLGHRRIITCQREIYTCVARDIRGIQAIVHLTHGDEETSIHIKNCQYNKKNSSVSIVITSWNETTLNQIVHRISKILQPVRVRIDVAEVLHYLDSKSKKSILRSVNHRFAVYAKVDWKSQCVSIYGVGERKEQALHDVQKQIHVLLWKYNTINLIGNNQPRGLVNVMIKRYGINLNKLQQLTGADVIQLNRNKKTLMVIGEKQSYAKVLTEIDLCCDTLDTSKEKSSHKLLANECVACLCQVDDDNYRLQYCGHLYCQQCITQQINCAIKSSSFPLRCANCNQGFVIHDLERLLIKSPQPRLFDVLLTQFVRRHPNVWHYCPTPECESLYQRSQDYEVFTCSKCHKKTCRLCDTEYHPGYDCDEMKLIRENPDASIETFLRQNSDNVKKCPTCSAAIEKIDGCNHMQCGFCHTHFCWLCLAGYQTSGQCYGHLEQTHGGYV